MTALAIVEYNCEYEGELREGGWTLVLATELDDGEIVYFSAENDEIYYSLEELLNYWTDISNAEVTDIILYW